MTSQSKEMKVQCLDRFGSLPQDITGNILTRMPIRDAIRTSIVTKKWRSGWKSMTKLVFDDKMVKVPSDNQQLKKDKLAKAILDVLKSLSKPEKEGSKPENDSIPEIEIDVHELDVDSEFDEIICYLSNNDHLKKLKILRVKGSLVHYYKLPSSFFSLKELEFIVLINCVFRPPMEFDGFKKLHTVRFGNVDITSQTLQFFLSNCPLRDLALVGSFARGKRLTFVELLQCVPLIQILKIKGPYMENLSAGGMPHMLPTSLVQLKCLYLGLCYDEKDQVSSALCLIRSSPILEELGLMGLDKSDTAQISKNFPVIQDSPGITLNHLDFFWMKNFANEDREVEFLKLIMAKSPMLKKAQIELVKSVSLEEVIEILTNLLEGEIPRASPSAKLIIECPKPSSR